MRSAELFDRLLNLVGDAPVKASRPVGQVDAPHPGTALGRVLVVEDNPVNQLVAQGLVSHLCYEVEIAENGAQAVDAVVGTKYAAVLMDCQMPVLDGYSATKEIRWLENGGERVPIIAMTAAATAEDRDRCLAAGMDDYISKPVDLTTLKEVLSRWVRPAGGPANRPDADPAASLDRDAPALDPGDLSALDPQRLAALREIGARAGPGLLPALVDAFTTASPVLLATMRAALSQNDPTSLRSAAHQLKGSAANMGATRVADLARQVETSEQTPGVALLDLLDSELESTGRTLRTALSLQ